METYLFTLNRYEPEPGTLHFLVEGETLEAAIEELATDADAVNYQPEHVQIATYEPRVDAADGTIEAVEKQHLVFDVWASESRNGEPWLSVALAKAHGTYA